MTDKPTPCKDLNNGIPIPIKARGLLIRGLGSGGRPLQQTQDPKPEFQAVEQDLTLQMTIVVDP